MIVIYTPKVTNRISYVFDFVFRQYYGLEYELTENAEFIAPEGKTLISYSQSKPGGFYTIYQDDLLLDLNIKEQRIFISRENEIPVFFQTTDHYDLKFDIFSCIFYLLSRYEEYLPHDKDEHGRYKSSNSILSHAEFNFSPVIEIWLSYLKEQLLAINPSLSFREYHFEYLPTIDIDNAFKYLGRNWGKHPPNIFNKEGRGVLFNKQQDPYSTFDFISEQLKKHATKPIFFLLMSDESPKDSRVSPHSNSIKKLIISLQKTGTLGIHPSYYSGQEHKIQKEKELLERISSSDITLSRAHFLRISFPAYFRELIAAGIKTDYSLCYPDIIGFRAGFSREFLFYDLETNNTTNLVLQPTCFMDATFEYYQQQKYEATKQEILLLLYQLKKKSGKLVTIFHNDLIAKGDHRNAFLFINQQINL